ERWRLVSFTDHKPLMIRPNAQGKITFGQRLRAGFSRWFFEDRISPVTKAELESAHGHGHHAPETEAGASHEQIGAKH
ncbi:hypothetical protein ACC691_38620, partial [Rhizobium johnstonii]|uniref:hypothetical protein n=1 Tax=Rhizobium johnstonii TaxID=3019933 RepID=UPI003F950976